MAAAVLFDYERLGPRQVRLLGALNDSKQHTHDAREALFPLVLRTAVRVYVVSRCLRTVDGRGLHRTNLAALREALVGVTAPETGEVLCLWTASRWAISVAPSRPWSTATPAAPRSPPPRSSPR